MIRPDRDPSDLTAQERLCEIAEILARGYLRLRIARQAATQGAGSGTKPLALSGKAEAHCGSVVQSPESDDAA